MRSDVNDTPDQETVSHDIQNATGTEHHTFWRQMRDHPVLHAVEFALTAATFALVGEVLTYFSYNLTVGAFSVVAGFLAMLFFVSDEWACQRQIERARKGRGRFSVSSAFYDADGGRAGQYTYLEQKQIELSIITHWSYAFQLLFDRAKWIVVTGFQAAAIMTLTVVLMAIHAWRSYPESIHADVVFWLKTGDAHILNGLLNQWVGVGSLLIFLFVAVYKGFFDRYPSGEAVLKNRVAEKLLEDRQNENWRLSDDARE